MVNIIPTGTRNAAIVEFLFHFAFFMIFLIPWTAFIGGFISMVILGNTFSPAESRTLENALLPMFIIAMLTFVVTGLIVTENA